MTRPSRGIPSSNPRSGRLINRSIAPPAGIARARASRSGVAITASPTHVGITTRTFRNSSIGVSNGLSEAEPFDLLRSLRTFDSRHRLRLAVSERSESNGGGEIRTHETLAGLPVFKTGAFGRSATPPGVLRTLAVWAEPVNF